MNINSHLLSQFNPSSSLFSRFNDLLTDVAERFVERGLGNQVLVHGSAATGSVSFLSFGREIFLVSDIDIIASKPIEPQIRSQIESELSMLPQEHLKTSWSPAVKVSIKNLNDELNESLEGASILRSVYLTGVPIVELTRKPPAYLNSVKKGVCFPLASS